MWSSKSLKLKINIFVWELIWGEPHRSWVQSRYSCIKWTMKTTKDKHFRNRWSVSNIFLTELCLWFRSELLMTLSWHFKVINNRATCQWTSFCQGINQNYECEWLDSNLAFFFSSVFYLLFQDLGLSTLICWMRARPFSFFFHLTLAPNM